MTKVALIGFNKEILSNIKLNGFKIIDANEIFGDIESIDRGNIKLRNLPEKINLKNFEIETFWRVKGEFEHYSSRRVIPMTFEEQDLLFRYILSLAIILSEQVDIMIFSNLPHQGVDSVINNCAKINGIPTYFFTPSIFKNYCYLMKQERNFSCLIRNMRAAEQVDLQSFDNKPKQNLYYMQKEYFPKKRNLFNKLETIFNLYKLSPSTPIRIIFKKLLNHLLHTDYRKIKWNSNPVFEQSKLNIYFPLHLQPELTTSNMGGIYFDQNYALKRLINHCENLNIDYRIYVKENPKQSNTNRMFLNQLTANKSLEFVDVDCPSELLIERCDVVCTISGTAGWEAIKSGKPCFIFGHTWYETAPGVQTDISKISLSIKNEKVDSSEVEEWFKQHQGFLHMIQNDITVEDMWQLIAISSETLESAIVEVM